jgi:hypothetical protein
LPGAHRLQAVEPSVRENMPYPHAMHALRPAVSP